MGKHIAGKPDYQKYVKAYEKAERHQKNIGSSMRDPMANRRSFYAYYEAMKNDLADAGDTETNIYDAIVERQQYATSKKQAKAYRHALDVYNKDKSPEDQIKMSWQDLLQQEATENRRMDKLFAEIQSEREKYKALGLNADTLIAQIYFGSL